MSAFFKRPPLLPSILTIGGVAVLCGLGTWQLDKYWLKTSAPDLCITKSAQERTLKDFSAISAQTLCPGLYTLIGTIKHQQVFPLGPRVHDGQPGYHLYSMLEDSGGQNILVNLGWTAEKNASLKTGEIQISGYLMKPPAANAFTPGNVPGKNEWYALDFKAIEDLYDVQPRPDIVLMAQSLEPEIIAPFYPASPSKTYLNPETHLQYASFWFFMAAALIAIFILRFMRPAQQNPL
jgi:surfeit locus 1 family protein